jgi:hypothetical protein
MIFIYSKIEEPIFEEKLTNFSNPGSHSADCIVLIIYQLQQSTAFAYTVFNQVKSVYYDGESKQEIARKKWTDEMKIHAQMRESTIARAPKSVNYTAFGKVFFAFVLIVLIAGGFLAAKSISDRKEERKQEVLLAIPPQVGDLYYGYFVEHDPSVASGKMLWTWLRVVKIEGKTYSVSINKTKEEKQSSDDRPVSAFEEHTLETELITGATPGFRTKDNSFDFLAKRKQQHSNHNDHEN